VLEGFDFGMRVAAADADFGVVVARSPAMRLVRVVTRTTLVVGGAVADLGEEVVDLALDGADLYLGVNEAGGADDLFYDEAGGLGELVSVNWVAGLIAASTFPYRESRKRASA
jgi:hypothetical protein